MNTAVLRAWTREAFFDWADAQEGRFEFDGVRPVAMTGGLAEHSIIHRNILVALSARLRGTCQALGPDAALATIDEIVRYPDVLVTCSAIERRARIIPGVMVVFEIISPTSGRTDRILKVREYAAVPSIRHYVIVESSIVGLTVMSRDKGSTTWSITTLADDDVLMLPEVEVQVPVAEIYRLVQFDEPAAAGA